MELFEKIIESVSPEKALRRMAARSRLNMAKKVMDTGYSESGASTQKHYGRGWKASSKSPQEDIDKNLPTLRERSRNLVMTAPLATSAIKTNRTNVVGFGLIPKPKIDCEIVGLSDEDAKKWEKRTEREFNLWASSKHSDIRKLNNFYENQQLVLMSQLMNGDACCLFSYADKKKENGYMPYDLRLNIIESDRICSPGSSGTSVNLFCKNEKNGNRIYNGVEIDKNGAVVAYHICSTYPSSRLDIDKKWERVEAFGKRTGMANLLMIFDTERAEQYRGVPYLAPVIESIKQLTRYTEAELMAAVVSSFFTAFISTEEHNEPDFFPGLVDKKDSVAKSNHEYEMGPGAVNFLAPGEKVEFGDPKHPGSNFELFVSSMSKYTGAALEIPNELLTKSFTASYSASRGALLEAWKMFQTRRHWLVNDFCQPVYERFLIEAVASGRIQAPGFFYDPVIRKAWSGCQWNGPAPGMIDPLKEVAASEKKIKLGVSTREKEAIELNGTDFSENIRQLGKEAKEIEQYLGKEGIETT